MFEEKFYKESQANAMRELRQLQSPAWIVQQGGGKYDSIPVEYRRDSKGKKYRVSLKKQLDEERVALLVDAMGGGLCPIHGAYLGHGKHNLRDCPYCDIDEYFKREKIIEAEGK